MIPRVLKGCLYTKENLVNRRSSRLERRRLRAPDDEDRFTGRASVSEAPDLRSLCIWQCMIGQPYTDGFPISRYNSIREAVYVKDGLGEWTLMPPPVPIPIDTVVDFVQLRRSIVASQAEVRRRMREPPQLKRHGIWYVDNMVPTNLRHVLMTKLDAIANLPQKDFHPGSDDQVQDLIHPSLFSYIEGVSPIIDPEKCPGLHRRASEGSQARFGHTNSKYQWLPSQFYVTAKGSVEIRSYINNLEEARNVELYKAIELMLELFLPMFEEILPGKNLRSRELQVIVKAANYIIEPKGQMYEGAWHVEGLPHEHIVATGLYYYSTSPVLKDKGLEFRRHRRHREQIHSELFDNEHGIHSGSDAEDDLDEGYYFVDGSHLRARAVAGRNLRRARGIPIGTVPTMENRLLVFPNTLQHKVSGIANNSAQEVGIRKTFLFFLVDPDAEIISTRDVHEQQWDSVKPLQVAAMNEVAKKIIGRTFPVEILDEIMSRAKRGLTLAEARVHRLQLIKDRQIKIASDNDEFVGVDFWARDLL